jgi:hypothetical protein
MLKLGVPPVKIRGRRREGGRTVGFAQSAAWRPSGDISWTGITIPERAATHREHLDRAWGRDPDGAADEVVGFAPARARMAS